MHVHAGRAGLRLENWNDLSDRGFPSGSETGGRNPQYRQFAPSCPKRHDAGAQEVGLHPYQLMVETISARCSARLKTMIGIGTSQTSFVAAMVMECRV